jgi:hypothetical protein
VLAAAGNDPRFRIDASARVETVTTCSHDSVSTGTRKPAATVWLGWMTGGDKLVLRGGYTRTHDYAFTNIALNIWSSFPFVAAVSSFPAVGGFDPECVYDSTKPPVQSEHR